MYNNGKELDVSNYTVALGSTIITLKKDYVSTLTAGTYTLKPDYTNGVSGSTTFEVKKKAGAVSTPTNPTDSADTTKSPKTGDSSDMGMWIMLLVLAAVPTIIAYRKRIDK